MLGYGAALWCLTPRSCESRARRRRQQWPRHSGNTRQVECSRYWWGWEPGRLIAPVLSIRIQEGVTRPAPRTFARPTACVSPWWPPSSWMSSRLGSSGPAINCHWVSRVTFCKKIKRKAFNRYEFSYIASYPVASKDNQSWKRTTFRYNILKSEKFIIVFFKTASQTNLR